MLDDRDRREVALPGVRKDRVAALLVEPFQFPAPQHEDAAQDEFGDPVGMGLRIGQRQRRPPRAAEHLPAVDLQVLAHALDVGNEMPGRVVGQFGMRRRAPASALVEQDDAVTRRIEEAPRLRVAACPRSAMQEHHRLAFRVAALFVVDPMQVGNLEETRIVGLDVGIERAPLFGCWHGGSSAIRFAGFSAAAAEKSHTLPGSDGTPAPERFDRSRHPRACALLALIPLAAPLPFRLWSTPAPSPACAGRLGWG